MAFVKGRILTDKEPQITDIDVDIDIETDIDIDTDRISSSFLSDPGLSTGPIYGSISLKLRELGL